MSTYYLVIVPALLLSVFGLIMGFLAQTVTAVAQGENPYTAHARPLIIILVSLVIATIVLLVPQRWLMYLAPVMLVSALGFQFLVLSPLGRSGGGNANWAKVGSIMAQPFEFLKPALIAFLAFMVSKSASKHGDWRVTSLVAGLLVLTVFGAVMLGRDVGTVMVVTVGVLGAMWVAGLFKCWFGSLVVLAVPTMVLPALSNPMRIRHILVILPGTSKGSGESVPEQTDHSLWVPSLGSLTGFGPRASRERWNYLQATHADFTFAIVGEEFGLFGTLGVLLCLGLLIWGTFRVTRESSDLFVTAVSSGVASWIGIQTVINVLSVMGLGPITGMPLPLVSYGGLSFLFAIIAIVVVASFVRACAGIQMVGHPDEASVGCDPRLASRRRSAR